MIKIRRIRAVVRKEWLQILRDRRSLFLALGIPMLMIVLFGWALKLDVTDIRTVIYDQDRSVVSRDFISKFSSIRYFDIVDYVYDYDDVVRLMDRGKIKAVDMTIRRNLCTCQCKDGCEYIHGGAHVIHNTRFYPPRPPHDTWLPHSSLEGTPLSIPQEPSRSAMLVEDKPRAIV